MAQDSRRRRFAGTVARNLAVSMAIGVAILFLMFVGRQEFWSWRLALYGALGGFAVYVSCHFLDSTIGDRIRRWRIVPDKVVGVPIYLIGGNLGLLVATALMKAFGLMPFRMTPRDLRIALVANGAVSVVVGLLFYSLHVMRERLEQSVERIKEAEFAEKELALARDIQRRLLPPTEIDGDGFRVAARNLAARFVAGDFYDVFRLADGAVGVVVADVSGKGIGSSLIMASVKAVIPFVAEGRRVPQTMTELNRQLAAQLHPREFVALAYARFDPGSGRLEIANAGLPDPYRLARGLAPEALVVPGTRLPLGVRREAVYESLEVILDRHEQVLFLTDGLPEAPTATGDPLGYERLESLFPDGMDAPAAWIENLFAAVKGATSDTLADDWTALLLERREGG
jgi:serine phosphatase RsbU (regulator of sigma subunit)